MKEQMNLGDAIRESLSAYEAPASLENWTREQLKNLETDVAPISAPAPRQSRFTMRRAYQWQIAAGLVIAAAAGWGGAAALLRPPAPASNTENEIVDAHVRSLLPGHLFDVASSDRHTVKPWFTGKTDIAPPVVDLSAKGFPLLGGRLDYVDGHSAAVLAYGRGLHTINLFIWRGGENEDKTQSPVVRGYSLVHWTNHGLSYWAISDAAPDEVDTFRKDYVDATALR
jgi:anti-sigma factor RsiW